MVDLGFMALAVWLGCFVLIAVDSAVMNISPWFWRAAGLLGGPFALVAYGIIRER